MTRTTNENGADFLFEPVQDSTLKDLLLPHVLPWYENQTRCINPRIVGIKRITNSAKFRYKVNVEYRALKQYDCTVLANGEVVS